MPYGRKRRVGTTPLIPTIRITWIYKQHHDPSDLLLSNVRLLATDSLFPAARTNLYPKSLNQLTPFKSTNTLWRDIFCRVNRLCVPQWRHQPFLLLLSAYGGHHVSDRFRVGSRAKSVVMVLRLGGWVKAYQLCPVKRFFVTCGTSRWGVMQEQSWKGQSLNWTLPTERKRQIPLYTNIGMSLFAFMSASSNIAFTRENIKTLVQWNQLDALYRILFW